MKIITGDKVKILIGKDKGRVSEVIKTFPKKRTVLVKGLNLYKKHVKATKNQAGGIVEKERAYPISKVALVCPNCQKTIRVSYLIDKSGDKTRYCRKCKTPIISSKVKS
jgi:large subunit ribosomal protein L24